MSEELLQGYYLIGGAQVFIATLLSAPSMSAILIIKKQKITASLLLRNVSWDSPVVRFA